MSKFEGVADTLYIPLTARIYVSEHFPEYFMDDKAVIYPNVSQLLKLFIIFPAVSALAAWICSLF